jgi:hypothetical protein
MKTAQTPETSHDATTFVGRSADDAAARRSLPQLRNCWEFKSCGREPGGVNVSALGVCPAFPARGRDCWRVAGTLCGGARQGTYAEKLESCVKCSFFERAMYGEG